MAYWLFKTEPNDYNWDQFIADGRTEWDGVRNHQAANNMRAMAVGDLAFFYRSMKDPAIIGTMRVVSSAYPAEDDPEGPFVWIDLEPAEALPVPVSLKSIKAVDALADLALVRQSRLSVMPVSEDHWKMLCEMGGLKG